MMFFAFFAGIRVRLAMLLVYRVCLRWALCICVCARLVRIRRARDMVQASGYLLRYDATDGGV